MIAPDIHLLAAAEQRATGENVHRLRQVAAVYLSYAEGDDTERNRSAMQAAEKRIRAFVRTGKIPDAITP